MDDTATKMEKLIEWCQHNSRHKLKKALVEMQTEIVGLDDIKNNVASQVTRHLMYEAYDREHEAATVVVVPPQTRAAKREARLNSRKRRRGKKNNWTRRKKHSSNKDASPATNTAVRRRRYNPSCATSDSEDEVEDPAAMLKQMLMIKLLEQSANGKAEIIIEEEEEHDSDWVESDDEDDEDVSKAAKRRLHIKYHTLLLGPPGCGKTTLAKYIRNIWREAGIVNSKYDTIGRTHVMSKWQGEASEKIRAKIESCSGGVLFVDECYGLVHGSNDTYGNEVLTAIVQAMTDDRCKTTFILAGYEKDVRKKLFEANCGLERRFDAIYVMKKATTEHLKRIFDVKNKLAEWNVEEAVDEVLQDMLSKHESKLQFGGGDVTRLVEACHRAHIERFFPKTMDCKLSKEDIRQGFKAFIKNCDKDLKQMLTNSYMYL